MKVNITIDDGQGRKAEIELEETDKMTKMMIIQQVFNLFGVKSDIMQFAKTMDKIEKAYSDFFSEVDVIEVSPPKEQKKIDKNFVKVELTKGLQESQIELDATYHSTEDVPSFVKTGIKERDGKKFYRTHYKCYACYFKSTLYMPEGSKHVWCQRCQHQLDIKPANPLGFPNVDTFNNFYVAGDFYDWNMTNSP